MNTTRVDGPSLPIVLTEDRASTNLLVLHFSIIAAMALSQVGTPIRVGMISAMSVFLLAVASWRWSSQAPGRTVWLLSILATLVALIAVWADLGMHLLLAGLTLGLGFHVYHRSIPNRSTTQVVARGLGAVVLSAALVAMDNRGLAPVCIALVGSSLVLGMRVRKVRMPFWVGAIVPVGAVASWLFALELAETASAFPAELPWLVTLAAACVALHGAVVLQDMLAKRRVQ